MADESPYVVVLNDFGGTTVEERERKSGKKHVTVTIKSEPIAVHLDPLALGQPVADAIASAMRDQIRGISERASDGTILRRKYAAAAFAKGETWAKQRYSGGRTGPKAPAKTDRLFNDSGRLADGITANQNRKEKAWTINAPVNRLDPSTFPSPEAFASMMNRLAELVPMMKNPLAEPKVVEAIERTWNNMITKRAMAAADEHRRITAQFVLEILRTAKSVLGA